MSKLSLKVLFLVLACFLPLPCLAETDVQGEIERLERRLNQQEKLVEEQQKLLIKQSDEINRQKKLIQSLTSQRERKKESSPKTEKLSSALMASQRGKGSAASFEPVTVAFNDRGPMEDNRPPQVPALANQGGILSPPGFLSYEHTFEYTNTTRNIFAFNGVELAQVVLVGGITAQAARHQIVQTAGRLRLGLTDRLEADVHVPFVYRNDALTNTVGTAGSTQTTVEGANLGDVDVGLAYQLNDGREGWPFFIGNLRYKANNADGPFDVPYDNNNIAKRLPTGTGFHTVEASITAMKVNDPAVVFANLGYVYDIPRDIDRDFNGVYITDVLPGDAINALVGMGFSINQDMSFSLGYKHSYVFPTIEHTRASGKINSGTSQVGNLTFGLTYALTPATSLNFNVEAGLTHDAPDVHLVLRIPFQLGKIF
jgi:uncharacterized coiled-coil protein SlyX